MAYLFEIDQDYLDQRITDLAPPLPSNLARTTESNSWAASQLFNGSITSSTGIVEQRNSTSPQTQRIYNTYASGSGTNGSNDISGEWIATEWVSNVAWLTTRKGTNGGNARDLVLGADGAESVRFTSAGRTKIDTLNIGRGGNSNLVSNVCFGFQALNSASCTGGENVAIGLSAMFANTTGTINCAVGSGALFTNTTGAGNLAFGKSTLYFNTTGNNNVAIGSVALFYNTTGIENVAVGSSGLFNCTTGSFNTAVGRLSLENLTTGNSNTVLGWRAGLGITTGSQNIAIGLAVDVDSPTASNQINIGNRYYHDRLRFTERTDPSAPAANDFVMYARDNGSGKTQACIRFATGAIQVIATEP